MFVIFFFGSSVTTLLQDRITEAQGSLRNYFFPAATFHKVKKNIIFIIDYYKNYDFVFRIKSLSYRPISLN